MPRISTDHDLIVLGGGAAGLGAVRAALWAGADVAIVTDSPPGGDCTFTGCVPSKTLLAAARDGLAFSAAMARVHATVERIAASESADVLRSLGVTVVEGRGRLVTHDTVAVDGSRISATRLVVATGSKPVVPRIEGVAPAEVLTNETVFELNEAPAGIDIIGGGPVGCELAEAFAVLGVRVALFEAAERLLPGEDPEASAIVESALSARGVAVRTGTPADHVGQTSAVQPESGDSTADAFVPRASGRLHPADRESRDAGERSDAFVPRTSGRSHRLLAAAGRAPATEGLGLRQIGVRLDDRGWVSTDDRLQTSVRGVFAAGDVTGRMGFTHAADEMGRLAASNALKRGARGRFRAELIPRAVFTDPEVAAVGVSPHRAPIHSRVAHLPLTEIDRAVTDGRSDGFVTLVAGPRRLLRNFGGGRLLGASVVAPRAGEMIQEAALAMRTGAFAGRLAQTSHAYPTWSHGVQKAAAQFFGEIEGRSARRVGQVNRRSGPGRR